MMLRASLLALALALPAAPVSAAGELPPLRVMEISRQLFEAGLATRDPLLMATAAQLRKGVALEAVARAGSEGAPLEGAPMGWEEMLDAAAEAAGEDGAMLAVIEDIRATSMKGVSTGPVFNISSLGAEKTDVYQPFPFDGGAYAEVYVEGGKGSDLNLYVFDPEGRLVCSDTDTSEVAYCGWRPAESAEFTVKVENKGAATDRYSLMTN